MANPAPLTDRVERSEAVDSTSEYRTAEHALVVTDSLEENQKDEGVLPTPLRKIMIPPRKKLASTASPKIGVKRKFKRNNVRKESDSEEEPVPKKPKTRLPTDPSRDQEKEMKYALKQAKAYRKGKHSNKGKSIRNLVREKVEDLVEEERRKNVKVAEKKQRLERAAGLMLETRQNDKNDKKDDEEVEDETNGKATDEFKDDLVDNGPMEEDTSSTEEGEREKDEETHLVLKDAKQNSDAESTKAQSGNGIMKLINNRSYEQKLSQLSKNLPSQEQIAKLGLASTAGPNFLGRTASLRRGVQFGVYKNKTNGYTSHDVLLPAADSHNEMYRSHAHLADMTQGNLRYMIGNHLVWKDLQGDELLSYSKDPLFLVVHALSRHHQNQGYVTIQFLVRSNAKAPDGTPAMFYSALDVYTIFDVPRWSGWGSNDNTKLHPRKFTQEYLSHGPVLTPSTGLKPALIVDLIKDGLYENFPEFEAPMNHKRTGLYTLQVVYRKIGYPPAPLPDVKTSRKRGSKAKKVPPPIYSYENCSRQVPMDEKLLNTVRKVTLNFRERPENVDPSTLEPPLHAFLCFLTFEKRQREDPTFLEWIKKHYNGISHKFLKSCVIQVLTLPSSTRRPRTLRRCSGPSGSGHDSRGRQLTRVYAVS